MKQIFYLALLLTQILSLDAQSLERAQKLFENKAYAKAISEYEAINISKPTKDNYIYLAKAYKEIGYYSKALKNIEIADKVSPLIADEIDLYVEILKLNEQYATLTSLMMRELTEYQKNYIQKNIDSINQWKQQDKLYEVINLSLNSKYSEFSISHFGPDHYIYTTNKSIGGNLTSLHESNNQPYFDLAIIEKKDIDLDMPKVVPFKNKKGNYHLGTGVYDSSTQEFYYTRNYIKDEKLLANNENKSNLEIVIAKMGTNHQVLEEKSFVLNNPTYSIGHPTLSQDGKRLYFISNMPGGYGGTDIYYTQRESKGQWGPAINCGPVINTSGNEMFPYIDPRGNLIFSSNGHIGLGGLDIFVSAPKGNNWEKPINLGQHINSPYDDFGLVYENELCRSGYFSSNRPSGIGYDDIYRFVEKKKEDNNVSIRVEFRDSKTKDKLPDVNAYFYSSKTGDSLLYTSDEDGGIDLVMRRSSSYSFKCFKTGYLTQFFDELPKDSSIYTVWMDRKELNNTVEIKNIYYEFDKASVHPNAFPILDQLSNMLNQNQDITIEIASHTDSRGLSDYNLELSQRRAESVAQYLIRSGFSPNKISAKGYGESMLLNRCNDDVLCTEEQHAINRRTEFRILGIGNQKIASVADESQALQVVHIPSSRAQAEAKKAEKLNQKIDEANGVKSAPNTVTIIDRGAPSENSKPTISTAPIKNVDNLNTNSSSISGYQYSIQIGSFNQESPTFEAKFTLGKVQYIAHENRLLATYGRFETLEEARLNIARVKSIVPDAFIIKLQDGKRVKM